MLRYIPGLLGALGAMLVFRLLGMLDFSVRLLAFIVAYVAITVVVDKAMARYGRPSR